VATGTSRATGGPNRPLHPGVLAPEIADIATVLQQRIPDVVDRIIRRIRGEVQFYREGVVVSDDELRTSVHANMEAMAVALTSERPDLAPPRETGRERAIQGAPLPDILHAYRLGFTELWAAIVEIARETPGVSAEMLLDAATGVWWLHGEYTQALTLSYRETAAELALARAQHRSALVEALFTGTPDRDTLWEAAKALGLPWEGAFVVVVAEAPELAHEGLPDAEALLAGRGIGSAWRLYPDIQMGVASLRDEEGLPILLRLLDRSVRARTGVSPVFRSLGGTSRALHHARLVMAGLPPGTAAVAQFEESPLRVLAAAVPETAGELARTVLGPVLDLPEHDRALLLDTLRAWFDSGGSATETGKRIYCHPNTVRYRLRRVQEYTGRSLDDPRSAAELLAALDALRFA
jgi:PucR C-terminal helix-turn-helix domain/GGDEF-like domain